MEKALVKTDIQIAVPSGCYGRVGKWFKRQVTVTPALYGNVCHLSVMWAHSGELM